VFSDKKAGVASVIVTHMYIRPLKGAGGIAVTGMSVGRLGPLYDHRWMVVDEDGMFVAQRSSRGLGIGIPQMCLIETTLRDGLVIFEAPGMPELSLPRMQGLLDPMVQVQVWERHPLATVPSAKANMWFTVFLSRFKHGKYRLVRLAEKDNDQTFADAFPFLIISQASLNDLNRRIMERRAQASESPLEALGWDRFRPTVVIDGCEAYAEDAFNQVRIGKLLIEGRTLCVRCPVTTTNQLTAVRGKEPLATLATYRRNPNGKGVVFGRNGMHLETGEIRVGDPVVFQ
jgi:uncharacterized protein